MPTIGMDAYADDQEKWNEVHKSFLAGAKIAANKYNNFHYETYDL